MPTYDYQCEKCGHAFEAFQSITEEPLKSCPECQGPVKRLIGAGAGLIFKGSGFYITDYKKKEPAKSGSSKSVSTGSGSPKGGTSKPKKKN